ncbi:Hsp33 family molecular chaperone HslO [Oleispirillum naphthae]|uniref:Hsp33 family molecular chaperone HslO n=1 Tax=Oleispirillum naphthae TaxID=2838853 RepID=UPI0030823BBC
MIDAARSMDLVLPFTVGGGAFRGCLVRLSAAADAAIAGHAPHPAVGRLAGEALALAAALGSSLKFDGVITVQTASDGPVPRIVADMTSAGGIRASLAVDETRLAALLRAAAEPAFAALAGHGRMAITIDQGEHTDRYQGIVALQGASLAETAAAYFRQSEQIDTALTLAAAPPADGFGWRAGGILLQRLPTDGAALSADEEADAWETARILHASLTAHELLDPALPAAEVLRRLFHASGLAVYAGSEVRFSCRCSRGRLAAVLAALPPADLAAAAKDGVIEVTCDFCKTRYTFDPAAIESDKPA